MLRDVYGRPEELNNDLLFSYPFQIDIVVRPTK